MVESVQPAIRYERDAEGIVTLTMDLPGRSTNVINEAFANALAATLDRLEQEKDTLVGVLLTSAKPTFLAGADLEALLALQDPAQAFQQAEQFKTLLRRLETLGRPVVAVINGTALGGGLELALACHRRIVRDDPSIRLGFPEVTLGLIPGGGGITRLVRLLGLQEAYPYLIEGRQLSPREALQAGIVHELAESSEALLEKARAWIRSRPDPTQPWDRPDYRMPGGDPRHPRMFQLLAAAPAMLRKQTWGNYPAPAAILSAAVEGALVTFDAASRIESRYFARVATGPVAKNMIQTFWFQLNEINRGRSRPSHVPPTETKKVGVLGAGLMGHGIAYVTALAGMEVVLKDVSREKAEAGKHRIARLLDERVAKGRLTPEEKQAVLDRIQTTDRSEDLSGCDLVIEAVFENRKVKAQVIREIEPLLPGNAVFGSNTSTLPITSLAAYAQRPRQFVGIHFFSPVHRMRLVELIRGRQTSDEALAKAFDYVRKIGKTPIVVNDSRGFYTSRVFGAYLNEGLALLAEGQHPRAIEVAGRQAGMPIGPLAVADEVGLQLMQHIREQTEQDLAAEGKTLPPHPAYQVLDVMVRQHNRLGKTYGAGFYEYPKDGPKYLWPELRRLFPPQGTTLSQQEMIDRLLFIQALETVRCLEEGVLSSVADANVGSVLGWGFAPFYGGTLQFINAYGLGRFVARAEVLAERYGKRFAPPERLREMARRGEAFV
ncbi:3-hydroxyacyl-CoA dehydrogenase NAD-binding domain-containing protein [Rhodothermus profundi]|uniref:3-hydroxyacyl-CoA dehydrogenase / enoyl-CoA hydratase / 3-hydroxybutyryl-CoA epimerase n=1 Tax=Rhodothermus profundi TaxID=633813 RepID=A0A1M6WW13_9BACT|nr:3-hydroxyacyl-CoA dehydrogenase NAD-binding domain-containing protein [Rhodothermus profundi]SHK97841.1 3-hydroxyacyl-CoA dehydrogenase / enoyl-CoA hydratase / 3-hydroxybutyryl-CoA epimerase [Rhodothermus profundi]